MCAAALPVAGLLSASPAAADNVVLNTGPTIGAGLVYNSSVPQSWGAGVSGGYYSVQVWGTGLAGGDGTILLSATDQEQPHLNSWALAVVLTTTTTTTICLPDLSCPQFPAGSIAPGWGIDLLQVNRNVSQVTGIEQVHCGDHLTVHASNLLTNVSANSVQLTVPTVLCYDPATGSGGAHVTVTPPSGGVSGGGSGAGGGHKGPPLPQ